MSNQIINQSEEACELDEDMLDRFERLSDIAEKFNMPMVVKMCDWVNGLYCQYEEAHSQINEMAEEKDYYEKRCRDEGMY